MLWLILAIPVGLLCLLIAILAGPFFAALFNTSIVVGYLIYLAIAAITIVVALKVIGS